MDLKLALLIASLLGQYGPSSTRVTTLTEALTRAAPTLETEGVSLQRVLSFRIIVCAESAQTLSGGGNLRLWHFNTQTHWAKNPTLDLPITATGVRCQAFPDVMVGPPMGRMLAAPDSVTVSGGTTVSVRYEVQTWG